MHNMTREDIKELALALREQRRKGDWQSTLLACIATATLLGTLLSVWGESRMDNKIAPLDSRIMVMENQQNNILQALVELKTLTQGISDNLRTVELKQATNGSANK